MWKILLVFWAVRRQDYLLSKFTDLYILIKYKQYVRMTTEAGFIIRKWHLGENHV